MARSTHRRRRRNRMATVMAFLLILVAIAALVSLLFVTNNVRPSVTVEAGQETVLASAFLKKEEEKPVYFVDGMDKVDLWTPGEYPVTVGYENKAYKVKLLVRDRMAPTGLAQNKTTAQNVSVPAEDFVTDIVDATPVTVTYKETPEFSKVGDQPVTLVLTDAAGNTTELTATLTVIADEIPPTIYGVQDITTFVGDTVSYKKGIYAVDNLDTSSKLTVDSSAVDLSKAGVYTITVTATDASGNKTEKTMKITVREKTADVASEETLNAMADGVIRSIIKEGMTKREQVAAIYNWARRSFGYSGHSDKSDWKQGAYTMLTKKTGDCFNYFAVTKLLLERLDIDNIDVRKVKNYSGDSDHFWSLVSVDGGKTWYHLDTTPRVGSGDDFCLVTDAFLDAYSTAHKNSHNRDKSLYPATPEA